MKYGIITHYDVHNHGALLQLNALARVLEHKGIDAAALRYTKNYDFMSAGLRNKYDISIRSVGVYWNYLCKNGIGRTLFNIRKKIILDRYKKEKRLIGEYYAEAQGIEAVVVGSDEVFALHTGPTPVLFGHALPGNRVFSYAGTFGPTDYEDIEKLRCSAFVRSGLCAMQGISVRDANSEEIVIRLTGQTPVRVCDPVLLYGYEQERASSEKKALPAFLLVYAYDNNMNSEAEVVAIRQYARERNLQVFSVGFYHKWCDRNINADPEELIAWFDAAQCVITDTFHGSVLSILTCRNFAVIVRGNANKLRNLLDEYTLTDRILDSDIHIEKVLSQNIDYEIVGDELLRRRRESMDFLDSMISAR